LEGQITIVHEATSHENKPARPAPAACGPRWVAGPFRPPARAGRPR